MNCGSSNAVAAAAAADQWINVVLLLVLWAVMICVLNA